MTFPHHDYQNDPSEGDSVIITADRATAVAEPNRSEVANVAASLRQHRVAEVILVHGTFAGNDVIGLMREVGRFSPRLANAIKSLGKQAFDSTAGDIGNYTGPFAECLSQLINDDESITIPVTRYTWSGENHHLGRADGATGLMQQILDRGYGPDQRVLCFGHSHGGNVLAMMGQLIGASDSQLDCFFEATRPHFRNPITGKIDLPQWDSVRDAIADSSCRELFPRVDVATFGAPLRYRWHEVVNSKLLHFVQHRALSSEGVTIAKLPQSASDFVQATGGDYVQQMGIGGTDFLHSIFAPRSWIPEWKLARLFEASIRRRDLAKNLQRGHRVSLDGTTLLVDYPDTAERWNRKLLGHGVYTRKEWLPFHLNEIQQRFYAKPTS